MKEIFEKFVQLGIIALFLTFCQTCSSDYIKGGDNKAIADYEKIISDNTYATAYYNPSYTVTTIKVAGLPLKMYDFEYSFRIENIPYSGKITLTEVPKNNEVKVFYLKENPNFNSIDPKGALKSEKEKNTSNKDLYGALFWGILSLLMIIGFIINTREIILNKRLERQNAL